MLYDIVIPRAFCTDHMERDLDIPTDGAWQSRGYKCSLTVDQLGDLLSDATLYSDCGGPGWDSGACYRGLGISARATVKRCEETLVKTGPPAGPDLPRYGYDEEGISYVQDDWGKYLRAEHRRLTRKVDADTVYLSLSDIGL